jgi:plasmid stabilization system protein ParE
MAHLIAPRAEADLDDIWFYVARESGSLDVATGCWIPLPVSFFF